MAQTEEGYIRRFMQAGTAGEILIGTGRSTAVRVAGEAIDLNVQNVVNLFIQAKIVVLQGQGTIGSICNIAANGSIFLASRRSLRVSQGALSFISLAFSALQPVNGRFMFYLWLIFYQAFYL